MLCPPASLLLVLAAVRASASVKHCAVVIVDGGIEHIVAHQAEHHPITTTAGLLPNMRARCTLAEAGRAVRKHLAELELVNILVFRFRSPGDYAVTRSSFPPPPGLAFNLNPTAMIRVLHRNSGERLA